MSNSKQSSNKPPISTTENTKIIFGGGGSTGGGGDKPPSHQTTHHRFDTYFSSKDQGIFQSGTSNQDNCAFVVINGMEVIQCQLPLPSENDCIVTLESSDKLRVMDDFGKLELSCLFYLSKEIAFSIDQTKHAWTGELVVDQGLSTEKILRLGQVPHKGGPFVEGSGASAGGGGAGAPSVVSTATNQPADTASLSSAGGTKHSDRSGSTTRGRGRRGSGSASRGRGPTPTRGGGAPVSSASSVMSTTTTTTTAGGETSHHPPPASSSAATLSIYSQHDELMQVLTPSLSPKLTPPNASEQWQSMLVTHYVSSYPVTLGLRLTYTNPSDGPPPKFDGAPMPIVPSTQQPLFPYHPHPEEDVLNEEIELLLNDGALRPPGTLLQQNSVQDRLKVLQIYRRVISKHYAGKWTTYLKLQSGWLEFQHRGGNEVELAPLHEVDRRRQNAAPMAKNTSIPQQEAAALASYSSESAGEVPSSSPPSAVAVTSAKTKVQGHTTTTTVLEGEAAGEEEEVLFTFEERKKLQAALHVEKNRRRNVVVRAMMDALQDGDLTVHQLLDRLKNLSEFAHEQLPKTSVLKSFLRSHNEIFWLQSDPVHTTRVGLVENRTSEVADYTRFPASDDQQYPESHINQSSLLTSSSSTTTAGGGGGGGGGSNSRQRQQQQQQGKKKRGTSKNSSSGGAIEQ